MKNLTTLPKYT